MTPQADPSSSTLRPVLQLVAASSLTAGPSGTDCATAAQPDCSLVRYVIVPRRHLYCIEVAGDSGRAIERFRDEAAAVERLRDLQSQQEKLELRLNDRAASRFSAVSFIDAERRGIL